MVDFVFLWLEVNGFRRVLKGIKYVAMSYMMFVGIGLGLAIGLNGLALFLKTVVVPAVQSHGVSASDTQADARPGL